jgi:cytochrome b subunit of formate dehydrogenase
VLAKLVRLLAEIGPGVIWVFIFIAAIVAVFVIFTGIALWATLRAKDTEQQQIRYQVFHDLLDLFGRGGRK